MSPRVGPGLGTPPEPEMRMRQSTPRTSPRRWRPDCQAPFKLQEELDTAAMGRLLPRFSELSKAAITMDSGPVSDSRRLLPRFSELSKATITMDDAAALEEIDLDAVTFQAVPCVGDASVPQVFFSTGARRQPSPPRAETAGGPGGQGSPPTPPGKRTRPRFPSMEALRANVGPPLVGLDDPLAMSSSSYFPPYSRARAAGPDARQGATPDPAQEPAAAAEPQGCEQQGQQGPARCPFPTARAKALRSKLDEVDQDVAAFRDTVADVMKRPHVHPTELEHLLQVADGIQGRSQLRDAELEAVGWPVESVREMRAVVRNLKCWQQWEEAAKNAVTSNTDLPSSAAIETLEQFVSSWCLLCSSACGPFSLDLGLERRARGAEPMLAALLDLAMALVRRQPDALMVRRLECFLKDSAERQELQRLGIAPLLAQTLRELREVSSGMLAAAMGADDGGAGARAERGTDDGATGACMGRPEALWRAVVDGDAGVVASIIRQGGLVSARTRDNRGHTVFWYACAFQRTGVALLLLKHFSPGDPYGHGVDLGELHAESGKSLLHLVACIQPFTTEAEGLFAMLFERAPEALRSHRTVRGQTFMHHAAKRLNFKVLQFAVARGLESLLRDTDKAGQSPCSLLARHLASRRVAENPASGARGPGGGDGTGVPASRIPPWCALGGFLTPEAGERPPFSDVIVEVTDERHGRMQFPAHRLVLATCSAAWHSALASAPGGGTDTAARRRVDDSTLRHVFSLLDTKGSGAISKRELIDICYSSPHVSRLLGVPEHMQRGGAPGGPAEAWLRRLDTKSDSEVTWEEFYSFHRGAGTTGAGGSSCAVLPLDPRYCSSGSVAEFVLRFLYTGEIECGFGADCRLLLQSLRLSVGCGLPTPLRLWVLDTLFAALDVPGSGAADAARDLLCEAEWFGLAPEHRRFAARRFLLDDEAWHAAEHGERARALELALAELEPCLATRLADRGAHAAAHPGADDAPGASAPQPAPTKN